MFRNSLFDIDEYLVVTWRTERGKRNPSSTTIISVFGGNHW